MPAIRKSGQDANPQGPSGATLAGPQALHFGNPVSWLLAIVLFAGGTTLTAYSGNAVPIIVGAIAAAAVIVSLQIAQAWEKAVVLRFGHFQRVAGPGVFGL